MVPDPRDELGAVPDIVSGGGDSSDFAAARWPGLVRLAFCLGLAGIVAAAESSGSVTLGTGDPGFSFGFIQVPPQVGMLVIDGSSARAVTATACGDRYRLIGFSYPLDGALPITVVEPGTSAPASFPVPVPVVSGGPSGSFPQNVGMWDNVGAEAPAASATIASGTVSGNRWSRPTRGSWPGGSTRRSPSEVRPG
ncbi:MAG: hypothetical protein ACRDPY_03245 [Streptosporangiaceae bacterium]